MKAYLKNIPVRLRNFNKLIDAKTYLCDKPWVVLNDGQTKELYIFRNNGDLILTRNGIAQIGHYTILPVDKILIDIDGNNYLFNPLISKQNEVLALKLDGNEQYSFLIDEQSNLYNDIKTFSDFEQMLLAQERRQIEVERKEAERKAKENEEKEKQAFYTSIGLGRSNVVNLICFIILLLGVVLFPLVGYCNNWNENYIILVPVLTFVIVLSLYSFFFDAVVNTTDKRKINKLLVSGYLTRRQREWLKEYFAKL